MANEFKKARECSGISETALEGPPSRLDRSQHFGRTRGAPVQAAIASAASFAAGAALPLAVATLAPATSVVPWIFGIRSHSSGRWAPLPREVGAHLLRLAQARSPLSASSTAGHTLGTLWRAIRVRRRCGKARIAPAAF